MPSNQVVIDSKPITTFVQVDTKSFKEVVQRLTGTSETAAPLNYKEQQLRSPDQQRFSPSGSGNGALQSSPLTTPTKCFSNLSLVERESGGKSAVPKLNTEEEEKAIKQRRFYLHPSPRSKPGFNEPELLSLFPLTSPETGKETWIGQGDRVPPGRE